MKENAAKLEAINESIQIKLNWNEDKSEEYSKTLYKEFGDKLIQILSMETVRTLSM